MKCFWREEKLFLEQEKREYIARQLDRFFYGEIKLLSYVLNMFMFVFNDYVYVNRQTFVWVLNYMSVWEKVHLKLK